MSRNYETIRLEVDTRGIARLILNRPDSHNAFNAAMMDEITAAAATIAGDTAVRAVVLSAIGKSFCAGADLGWMRAQFDSDRAGRAREASRLAAMLRRLDELPVLLLTVIEGATYGGGVGLAAVSDIVLASPDARFALTETRLGLIPATIAPFVVARIGLTNVRRFALNAAPFDAGEARDMGLVSEIHERHELSSHVDRHIALTLACAPGALADAKQLFRRTSFGRLPEAETTESLMRRWESDEARQGIGAFFRREKPPWAP